VREGEHIHQRLPIVAEGRGAWTPFQIRKHEQWFWVLKYVLMSDSWTAKHLMSGR
jgi:hypothetical protein